MKIHLLFAVLLCSLMAGCSGEEKSNDSILIDRIKIAEANCYSVYFSSGNRDAAEGNLRKYLRFLDDASTNNKMTPVAEKVLYSGRALALARLELLLAQKQKRPIYLAPAILEWRKYMAFNGEHHDDGQIKNFLVSFLRSDVPKAPWLSDYDDIINRGD